MARQSFYGKYVKRILDFIAALLIVVLFCWLYLILWILVRTKLGSPVFFRQERPGRDGKIFPMYKFRTMTDERGEDGELLPDEKRLTKFGNALRKTSLDELPEVFNILKGDMSFVGPRPLLVKYLPLYSEEQMHRHDVRPGLSGWAQVNGRNAISWQKKFEYDLWYVQNLSFGLDLKILWMTVGKAFVHQEGISSETSVTMEEFKGNDN